MTDIFRTMNAGFAQALYEQFLRDPDSVDPEWRALFEDGVQGLAPLSPLDIVTASSVVPTAEEAEEAGAAPRTSGRARAP